MNLRISLCLAGTLLVALAATAGAATTIYSDDFSGSGAVALNGQAPDVRPGTETWASSNLNSDGSILSAGTSSWLPVSIENDKVYTATLSSDILYQAGSGTYVYLGFTENDPAVTGNMLGSTQLTYAYIGVNRGGGYEFYPGPNNDTPATVTGSGLFDSNQDDLAVTLELTTSSTSDWTMAGYVGGVQVDLDASTAGLLYTLPTAYSFKHVGMGYHSSTFLSEGFNLTVADVPEPATMSLLASALGMLVIKRRKNKAA